MCAWAPSSRAVAVAVALRPNDAGPSQLLVFTEQLALLWEQAHVCCISWAPCSTVLALVHKEKLDVVTLPGSSSDASGGHLQQIAVLQAQTARLRVTQVTWSAGGACYVSAVTGIVSAVTYNHEDALLHSLHVLQSPRSHPLCFRRADARSLDHLTISPSGQRAVFTARARDEVRVRWWLLETRVGNSHMQRTGIEHGQGERLDPWCLAWHPSERYIAVLTCSSILVCNLVAGPAVFCRTYYVPMSCNLEDWTRLSFSSDGARLHATVSRTKAIVFDFSSSRLTQSRVSAERRRAALAAARPLHWHCDRARACMSSYIRSPWFWFFIFILAVMGGTAVGCVHQQQQHDGSGYR